MLHAGVVQEYLPLGRFSELEAQNFQALKAELRASIKKGVDFVAKGKH
jgi:malate dehydrogenase